jgi:hypothetical protein
VIMCTPSKQPLLAGCKRGALVIALGAGMYHTIVRVIVRALTLTLIIIIK